MNGMPLARSPRRAPSNTALARSELPRPIMASVSGSAKAVRTLATVCLASRSSSRNSMRKRRPAMPPCALMRFRSSVRELLDRRDVARVEAGVRARADQHLDRDGRLRGLRLRSCRRRDARHPMAQGECRGEKAAKSLRGRQAWRREKVLARSTPCPLMVAHFLSEPLRHSTGAEAMWLAVARSPPQSLSWAGIGWLFRGLLLWRAQKKEVVSAPMPGSRQRPT